MKCMSSDELKRAIYDFVDALANGKIAEDVAHLLHNGRGVNLNKPDKQDPIEYDEIIGHVHKKPYNMYQQFWNNDTNISNQSTKQPVNKPISRDIRPIVIGTVWSRLAHTYAVDMQKNKIIALIEKSQLGNNIPGGIEALVEMAHRITNIIDNDDTCETAAFKLDFQNCFNSIDRNETLEWVYHNINEWYPLMYQMYHKPNVVVHASGDYSYMSNGLYQGQTTSGLCLAGLLTVIHRNAKMEAKDEDNTFTLYASGDLHDDNTTCGTLNHLSLYYKYIEKHANTYGMKLNPAKSELIVKNELYDKYDIINKCCKLQTEGKQYKMSNDELKICDDNNIPDIPLNLETFKLLNGSFEALGVPVGDSDFIDEYMCRKIYKIRKQVEIIAQMDSRQLQHTLLTEFFNLNKFNYLWRNVPYDTDMKWYQKYDELMEYERSILIRAPLDQDQIEQTTLSIKHGGLGLRDPLNYTCASYLSSMIKNDLLMPDLMDQKFIVLTNEVIYKHATEAINIFDQNVHVENKFGSLEKFSKWYLQVRADHPTGRPSIQSKLYNDIDKYKLNNIFATATPRKRAIMTQQQDNITYKWLQTRRHQSNISNIQWHYAILRWLGVKLFYDIRKCVDCSQIMDQYGDHSMICKQWKGIKYAHNCVQHHIVNAAQKAGCNVIKEYKLDKDSEQRPADIWIENFGESMHLALDICLTACTNKSIIKQTQQHMYYAANQAYIRKENKYRNYPFKRYNTKFMPFIMEEFGALHWESKKIWEKICELGASKFDVEIGKYKLYQTKMLSTNIVKMNIGRVLRKCNLGSAPKLE